MKITDLLGSFRKAFGIKGTMTNFLQYQSTVKFIDRLSFEKYGHVHYTYDGGKNVYDVADFKVEQIDFYKINEMFITKNKFCASKEKLDKNDELIYDLGGSKGKVADYELVGKVVEYAVSKYKFLGDIVMKYLRGVMEEGEGEGENEDEIDEVETEDAEETAVETETNTTTISPNAELKKRILAKIMNMEMELKELRKMIDEMK